MNTIQGILNEFHSISLQDLDTVSLLRRVDTKYILSLDDLKKILPLLQAHYDVLEINNCKLLNYNTEYLDTKDLACYRMHHNNKSPRFKIRFREYVESDITFLEFKEKIKGRTDKKREVVSKLSAGTTIRILSLADRYHNINTKDLATTLTNNFRRCTLVDKDRRERITIDLDINFKTEQKSAATNNLVIAELKQRKLNRYSIFYSTLRQLNIRPSRVSKYCLGIMLTYPSIKKNRFKRKLNQILNITNNDVITNSRRA